MKFLFYFIALTYLSSCGDPKQDILYETNRINNKVKKLESAITPLITKIKKKGWSDKIDFDSIARHYFELVKKDKDLIGFCFQTPHGIYSSEDMQRWSVNLETDNIFNDSLACKQMIRGDVYFSKKNANHNMITKDIMFVDFSLFIEGPLEIFLFYKLEKEYPNKFDKQNTRTISNPESSTGLILLK